MLRVGRISEQDPSNARVRVTFSAEGVTTGWLQTLHNGASEASWFHTFPINELVAVALEGDGVYGFVLGAVYSGSDVPAEAGENVVSVAFPNGDKVIYDGAARTLKLTALNGVTITGDLKVTGDVKAGATETSLTLHTHVVAGVQAGAGSITSNPPL